MKKRFIHAQAERDNLPVGCIEQVNTLCISEISSFQIIILPKPSSDTKIVFKSEELNGMVYDRPSVFFNKPIELYSSETLHRAIMASEDYAMTYYHSASPIVESARQRELRANAMPMHVVQYIEY